MSFSPAPAEKTMVYDEEKGIIFVEKDSTGKAKSTKPIHDEIKVKTTSTVNETTTVRVPVARKSAREDIQADRKKDPPELYFKSGIEYFGNSDFENALKNFHCADSLNPSPLYLLWIGKTYRRMNDIAQMKSTMQAIITQNKQSDVADDALFEIAFYYQTTDAYDSANATYAQLAEQYPFGTSWSTGGLFREVAREERRSMREELLKELQALGAKGNDLTSMISSFQRTLHLDVTGIENRTTVQAIKTEFSTSIKRRAQDADRSKFNQKHKRLSFIAIGIFSLSILSLLLSGSRIKAARQEAADLRQILTELKI